MVDEMGYINPALDTIKRSCRHTNSSPPLLHGASEGKKHFSKAGRPLERLAPRLAI